MATVEWQWSLLTFIKGSGIVGSFALPAWAASASHLFHQYAPFSWVAAGFGGMLIVALSYAVYARAYARFIRAKYDAKMFAGGTFADPMAKTYENRRIFLNEFCLPSFPLIENKTFINCEIIGPSNIVLEYGNNVQEVRYPISDAVLMKPNHQLFNAIIVRNCVFRQCSFQRITFLVPHSEYEMAKHWAGFNWITENSPQSILPTGGESLTLLPASTGEEAQP